MKPELQEVLANEMKVILFQDITIRIKRKYSINDKLSAFTLDINVSINSLLKSTINETNQR